MALSKWIQGTKVNASAGDSLALVGSSTVVCQVIIQQDKTNTGEMYIGGSAVAAAAYGFKLSSAALETVTLGPVALDGREARFDLADIYIDAEVNGDGVFFFYLADQ